MKKTLNLIVLLSILAVGCAAASPTQIPPTLPPATPTALLTLTSTPPVAAFSEPTVAPIRPAPTQLTTTLFPPVQEVVTPQQLTICPEQHVIPFENLELSPDVRLLVLPSSDFYHSEYAPLVLSPGDPTPRQIANLAPSGWRTSYDVSPDHRWLSFYCPGNDEQHKALWISSLDGQKQWPVIQIHQYNYARWVSDQEVFIVGSPRAEEYEELTIWDYFPFMSINPFTLEQRSLTYLAGGPMSGIHYYGALSSQGHSYALYGRLNLADYLYDYEQEKALPVFQWLNELDLVKSITIRPVWVYDGDKFAVTVARPDGLDVAMGLDIRSASEGKRYNEVMKKILLPERLLPLDVLGIGPQGLLALQRAGYASPIGGPDWFYVFDYQNMSIRDYCLDLSDGVWSAEFSPDGRFAAFTLQRSGAMLNKSDHYVAIIDLDKGTVAYLEGYIVVGWGIVTESP